MTINLNSLTYDYCQNTFAPIRALDQVSLQIQPGELVGVVGPSGAGKSCLLRCLAGVLSPTGGQICLTASEGVPQIGLMMQEPERQFFLDTVYEEVAFALTLRGRPETEINLAVNRILHQVGYHGDLKASPFRLSGGQQRRVAIASILIMNPDLLLLDEPTVGMDAQGLTVIRTIVAEFRRKKGTVIMVTHDQDFLYRQVDRVLVLKEGRLQADFKKKDWLSQADLLAQCGVTLPEILQLVKRGLPDEIRKFIAEASLKETDHA
jgi:energy-coupling factor transporter ATP-binding protein EcfA2